MELPSVRDAGVAGSNPATPTNIPAHSRLDDRAGLRCQLVGQLRHSDGRLNCSKPEKIAARDGLLDMLGCEALNGTDDPDRIASPILIIGVDTQGHIGPNSLAHCLHSRKVAWHGLADLDLDGAVALIPIIQIPALVLTRPFSAAATRALASERSSIATPSSAGAAKR